MRILVLLFTALVILSSCGGRLYNHTLVKRKAACQKQAVQNKRLIKPVPGLIVKVPSPAVSCPDSVMQPVVSVVKIKLPSHSVKAATRTIKKEHVYEFKKIQKIQAENTAPETVPTLKYKGWRIAGLLFFLFTGIGISIYLCTFLLPTLALIPLIRLPGVIVFGTYFLLLAGIWYGGKNYSKAKKANDKGFISKLAMTVLVVNCLGLIIHTVLGIIVQIATFIAFYKFITFQWLF